MVLIPICASVPASVETQETAGATATTRRRGGAPRGNKNALKSGLRHGLTSGRLPAGCSGIRKLISVFRQAIEEKILTIKGEVSLYDAALVNSAIRWERHALLAQRWLFTSIDAMNADQRLTYSREIARASSERDKCLLMLGIDEIHSPSSSKGSTSDGLPPLAELVFDAQPARPPAAATPPPQANEQPAPDVTHPDAQPITRPGGPPACDSSVD